MAGYYFVQRKCVGNFRKAQIDLTLPTNFSDTSTSSQHQIRCHPEFFFAFANLFDAGVLCNGRQYDLFLYGSAYSQGDSQITLANVGVGNSGTLSVELIDVSGVIWARVRFGSKGFDHYLADQNAARYYYNIGVTVHWEITWAFNPRSGFNYTWTLMPNSYFFTTMISKNGKIWNINGTQSSINSIATLSTDHDEFYTTTPLSNYVDYSISTSSTQDSVRAQCL